MTPTLGSYFWVPASGGGAAVKRRPQVSQRKRSCSKTVAVTGAWAWN